MLAEIAKTQSQANVVSILQNAAAQTGSDFHYLLSTAMRESSLKPQAQSSSSSAAGLFQFVEQTWLGLVKNYGSKFGLDSYASEITKGSNGHYHVADSADRKAILALRKDPKTAALMAGEFSNATRATLKADLGRDVCGGELYAAHFLGTDGACRLIKMSDASPDANAAHAFPQAAGANRSVFYHANGTAKSVREVYDWALKQTNAKTLAPAPAPSDNTADTIIDATPGPDKAPLNRVSLSSVTSNIGNQQALMALASWTPSHGFFSQDGAGQSSLPLPSVLLSPALMDILARAKAH
jgi:hypothetical protein